MLASIRPFWDILLIRRGPRDVPASATFLVALGVIYLSVEIAESSINLEPGLAVACSLADVVVTCAGVGALLALRRRGHRLPQTLVALFGTGLLLAAPAVAILLLSKGLAVSDPIQVALALLWYSQLFWGIFVTGHILREALDVHLSTGVAIALTYTALWALIMRAIVPPVPA